MTIPYGRPCKGQVSFRASLPRAEQLCGQKRLCSGILPPLLKRGLSAQTFLYSSLQIVTKSAREGGGDHVP